MENKHHGWQSQKSRQTERRRETERDSVDSHWKPNNVSGRVRETERHRDSDTERERERARQTNMQT